MPVVRQFGCPACGGTFEHWVIKSDDPPAPDHCPLCQAFVGDEEPQPSAPRIRDERRVRAVEDVQNAVVKSSEVRAELADNPALKITDLDSKKPYQVPMSAEGAAINQRARAMSFGGSSGAEYAAASRVGPYAGAGAGMMSSVVRNHNMVARSVAAQGRLNSK